MAYTQGIYIDGTHYDVPLIAIKRSADVLDKYAARTEDGDLHRELIGVYYNYELAFGRMTTATHAALFSKLTEPVAFHTLILPENTSSTSFTGYVSSVKDEIFKIEASKVTYKNLTCKFTAKQPTRTPSDMA